MGLFGRSQYEGRRASEIYADSRKETNVKRVVSKQCQDNNAKNKGKK